MRSTPGAELISPTPTRTAWAVYSEQSGALVIGPIDDRNVAASEADRLNGEAAKVTGVVDGTILFAVQQEGDQTRYVIGPIEVLDEEARRAELQDEVKRLEKARKDAGRDDTKIINSDLDRIRRELDEDA